MTGCQNAYLDYHSSFNGYVSEIVILSSLAIKEIRCWRIHPEHLLYALLQILHLFKLLVSYLCISVSKNLSYLLPQLWHNLLMLRKLVDESCSGASSCISASKEESFELVYQVLGSVKVSILMVLGAFFWAFQFLGFNKLLNDSTRLIRFFLFLCIIGILCNQMVVYNIFSIGVEVLIHFVYLAIDGPQI